MKCPDCGNELPHVVCPHCQGHSPLKSRFCCRCGKPLPEDAVPDAEFSTDFSKRKLCSDGTCIGVIGKNGRCQICGKPYTGDPV